MEKCLQTLVVLCESPALSEMLRSSSENERIVLHALLHVLCCASKLIDDMNAVVLCASSLLQLLCKADTTQFDLLHACVEETKVILESVTLGAVSVDTLRGVLDLAIFLTTHGPDTVSLAPLHRLADDSQQHTLTTTTPILRTSTLTLITSLRKAEERRKSLWVVDEQRCPNDALSWHSTFSIGRY